MAKSSVTLTAVSVLVFFKGCHDKRHTPAHIGIDVHERLRRSNVHATGLLPNEWRRQHAHGSIRNLGRD